MNFLPKTIKSMIAIVLASSFFLMPIQSTLLAQDKDAGTACVEGQQAAEANVKGGTWFAVGCLLGLTGWIVSMLVEPSPPASSLVGKSAEYVASFSDCYKSKGKSIQQSKAMTGCLVGTGVTVALYAILIAAAASNDEL